MVPTTAPANPPLTMIGMAGADFYEDSHSIYAIELRIKALNSNHGQYRTLLNRWQCL
ncbi:hypothetical protein OG698_28320 [Streptomyces sp. NBC_01003]|uniref:hypothetical protein n=1 Tax=Streptomyces sp. NBC_01003 TaxID=2903714 RepID=UPI00386EECFE|nr:hypothetical protein OG698_28320 [Streptomyces sp. NBC_01003]